MGIVIKGSWRPLLLALTDDQSGASAKCKFPILTWVLKHSRKGDIKQGAISDEERQLVDYALEQIDLFVDALPTLQDLLQSAVLGERLVLPESFGALIKAKDPATRESDTSALFDALTKVYQGQKKSPKWLRMEFEPKVHLWDGDADPATVTATAPEGAWIRIDFQNPQTSVYLPIAESAAMLDLPSGETLFGTSALAANDKVAASLVDPRNLYTYASTNDTIPEPVESPGVAKKVPLSGVIDKKSEFERLQDVLSKASLDGVVNEKSVALIKLVFDAPAAPEQTAEKLSELARERRTLVEKTEARLLGLADEIPNKSAGITYNGLAAALWARRLRVAAKSGISFLVPSAVAGELPNSLPPWSRSANANWDDGAVEALYFLAIRAGTGAGAKSFARSLDFLGDGGNALVGIASLGAEIADVYSLSSAYLKGLASSDSVDGIANLASEAVRVPVATSLPILRPKLQVRFAKLHDAALLLAKDTALATASADWLKTRDPADLLKSPVLQESLVSALRSVSERDLFGGMPTVISELAREMRTAAPSIPGTPPASNRETNHECSFSLARVLGCRYLHLAVLFEAKALRGSRDIARLGRARFINLFKVQIREETVSEHALMEIFSRAWNLVNARAQFFASALDAPAPGAPQSSNNSASRTAAIPDLRALFLQTDLPSCKWGNSLHGPGSYLVDILEFVRHRELESVGESGKIKSALSVLFERRPDLLTIDLTDANSQTTMPFIDLVCELLEAAVSPDCLLVVSRDDIGKHGQVTLSAFPELQKKVVSEMGTRGLWLGDDARFWPMKDVWDNDCCPSEVFILRDKADLSLKFARHLTAPQRPEVWNISILPQTTLTTRELNSEPQYLNANAYREVANGSSGYALPWSLGEAQITAYLKLVDLTREQIWKATVLPQPANATRVDHVEAWLSLGLQTTVGQAIFSPGAHSRDHLLARRDLTTPELTLALFLERSGLDFSETQELARSKFIGAKSEIGFSLAPNKADPCSADADNVMVRWTETDEKLWPHASTVARFLRLRRHLNWSVAQLDRAVCSDAIGRGLLDKNFSVQLADLERLRVRLHLSVDDALAIYSALPTDSVDGFTNSTWWRTFLDPRVNGAAGFVEDQTALAAIKLFALNEEGKPLAAVSQKSTLERACDLLSASLRLKREFVDALGKRVLGRPMADCRRVDLDQLYGVTVLLRALGKPLPEFVALMNLVESDKVLSSPTGALAMLDMAEALQSASVSPRELYRLLTAGDLDDFGGPVTEVGPTPDEIGRCILQLKAKLAEMSGTLLESGAIAQIDQPGAQFRAWETDAKQGIADESDFNAQGLVDQLVAPLELVMPLIAVERERLLQRGEKLGAELPTAEAIGAARKGLLDKIRKLAAGHSNELSAWLNTFYAPVLRWADVPLDDIAVRMKRIVDLHVPTLDPPLQTTHTAGPTTPTDAYHKGLLDYCVRLTYLLARPLQRYVLLSQRRVATNETIGSLAKVTVEQALSVCKVLDTPDIAGEPHSYAESWLLKLDLEIAATAENWKLTPAELYTQALGARDSLLNRLWRLLQDFCLAAPTSAKLALSADDVAWLESVPDSKVERRIELLDGLSLNKLPKASEKLVLVGKKVGEDLAKQVNEWQALVAFAGLFRAYPPLADGNGRDAQLSLRGSVLEPLLAADFNVAEKGNIVRALSTLTGWPRDIVGELLPDSATDLVGTLTTASAYEWLDDAVNVSTTGGLRISEMKSICDALNVALSSEGGHEQGLLGAAAAIRKTLRKRFTEPAWLDAMKNAQDELRTSKRDSLVAWLTGERNPPYADSVALSEAMLIDIQMGAVMDTSRIVQAHMAVQQFVQRCLMGLESDWQIPAYAAEDWKPWKWMSRFRLWEACRKIFLYPENWMDPEIRDDKSQFFEELESDLGQGELTQDNADTAVKRYLHKLHEVARLEVIASYYEFDVDTPTMHVVARTPSEPRRYFYRQWQDERVWTPWELVDLEISSDHVLVYKRNGRVYIGWITFQQKEVPASPQPVKVPVTDGSISAQEPRFQWRVQLTTSERAHEGWRPKRVSPDTLDWPADVSKAAKMSELTSNFCPKQVQPVYQDYGRPEILLLQRLWSSDANDEITSESGDRLLIGSFVLSSCIGTALRYVGDESRRVDVFPDIARADTQASVYAERKGSRASDLDTLVYVEGNGSAAGDKVDVLQATPGRFTVTVPQQATLLDLALAVTKVALAPPGKEMQFPLTMGVALPFFYSDRVTDMVVTQHFPVPVDGSDASPKGQTRADALASPSLAANKERDRPTLDARKIARVMRKFSNALVDERVQQVLYAAGANASFSPSALLKVLREVQPRATPDELIEILQAITEKGGKRTFSVASRNYHPLACELVRRAEEKGIESVYARDFQLTSTESINRGRQRDGLSGDPHPFGEYALGFEDNDAYAGYNWEVFFHIPFLTAMRFVGEAKFEDALRWFNLIFDPVAREGLKVEPRHDTGGGSTAGDNPSRYWRMQRFFLHRNEDYKRQRIDVLLDPNKLFGSSQTDREVRTRQLERFAASILEWRKRPNLPFQVGRRRWVAFQKAVVYRFIETILAWGDSRFRIDTREEINEATQLYFLAGKLLGRRPRTDIQMCDAGTCDVPFPQNYEQLVTLIDKRDDELSKQLDDLIDVSDEHFDCWETDVPDSPQLNFYNEYFCVPPNEKLVELWDRVSDRLYKIHNSQNIDGVIRSLSLFAPPIDPALIARAGALGLSFDQIIAGMNQPRAHYRFSTVLQKASELANELRVLGGELLQALEKRDAEELGLLRSRLDLQLTRMNTDTRKAQIREATEQIAALSSEQETVAARQAWYSEQVRGGQSSKEKESINLTTAALVIRVVTGAMKAASGGASLIPKFTVGINGAFGSPHSAIEISGEQVANAGYYFSESLGIASDILQTEAGIASTLAAYERREKEWRLQTDLATGELKQLEKQILAAQIRLAIAEMELRNHERVVENAEQVDEYLKSKFTNNKLYDWMVRQISGVYFKTYQMTLDMARAAEDCLNRELPLQESVQSPVRVVQPGHWDGLRKGLLAGNGLIQDLKRLDVEYLKRNKRTPELTKHVSLAVVDPIQLLQLRATGKCEIDVPEVLYDMDHAGHWGRRIKSVSMSMPCVAGPYTGISCELRLKSSRIRIVDGQNRRFEDNPIPAAAIYTSTGVNDSGLFELNLRDERYLPFEGAGAESTWGVTLPKLRQFDYSAISDVVLHIRYTSVPGSPTEVDKSQKGLAEALNKLRSEATRSGLWAMVSLRSNSPDVFNRVRTSAPEDRTFTLQIERDLLRWGGQNFVAAKRLQLVVIGDATSPQLAFPVSPQKLSPFQRSSRDSRYWQVDIDISGEELFTKGMEMSLQKFTTVEDIVLLVNGSIAEGSH